MAKLAHKHASLGQHTANSCHNICRFTCQNLAGQMKCLQAKSSTYLSIIANKVGGGMTKSRGYGRIWQCGRQLLFCLLLWLPCLSQAAAVSTEDFQQAWLDLTTLADDRMAGRATGTPGSLMAQNYILSRFEQLGLTPFQGNYRQKFIHDFSLGSPLMGTNLIGMRKGCVAPDHYIIITAHYDHLPAMGRKIYNGADDNASGVAGLLYLAKLSGENCPAYSQLFVATDGEERGLYGAKSFWAKLDFKPQVVLNINLDMISRGEKSAKLYVAGSKTFPQLKTLAQQINQPQAPVKLVLARDRKTPQVGGLSSAELIDWPNASDHAVFRRAGIPYCYYGVDDHPQYHTVDDDWQRINRDFFQAVLAIIAKGWHFADEQPLAVYQALRKPASD